VLGWHFSPRPDTVGLAQQHIGLGVARPVGTPRGSDGDCVGQGGAARFSPEKAGGGGMEKTTRRGSIPRRWRSSGGRGGRRRVLQPEERTRQVRHGPKGADDGGTAEHRGGGGE
jgi:hypothetical protein